jgi:hypothetical protein
LDFKPRFSSAQSHQILALLATGPQPDKALGVAATEVSQDIPPVIAHGAIGQDSAALIASNGLGAINGCPATAKVQFNDWLLRQVVLAASPMPLSDARNR